MDKEWKEKIREIYNKKDSDEGKFVREIETLERFDTVLKKRVETLGYKFDAPLTRGGTSLIYRISKDDQKFVLKFNRPGKDRILSAEVALLLKIDYHGINKVYYSGELRTEENEEIVVFLIAPFIESHTGKADEEKDEGVMVYCKFLINEINNTNKGGKPSKIDRLNLVEEALRKLVDVIMQWTKAISVLHSKNYIYVDIKPANGIVDLQGHFMLIDLGSAENLEGNGEDKVTIKITQGFEHPDILKKLKISGDSSRFETYEIARKDLKKGFDYFTLGLSVMILLKEFAENFPSICPRLSIFRYLHLFSTRLLDGQNGIVEQNPKTRDLIWVKTGLYKITAVFQGLTNEDYSLYGLKYSNLADAVTDLKKELGLWSPSLLVPELSERYPSLIKIMPGVNTTFTERIRRLITHPLFLRLNQVTQLGLISLVYPTAKHSRYDHSIGVYTYAGKYIESLYNDTWYPIFRQIVTERDINSVLVAALLHDLGQYPLAHDLEEVCDFIFDHVGISLVLLENETIKNQDKESIKDIIETWWEPSMPNAKEKGEGVLDKVKQIVQLHSHYEFRRMKKNQTPLDLYASIPSFESFKVDILSSIIDGPIDSDKLDYIQRDSIECDLPYGNQIDLYRLLDVLTLVPNFADRKGKGIPLGVYEKGKVVAEAISFARYELFASVYWHHTSRAIKTMIQYAMVSKLESKFFDPRPDEDVMERMYKFRDNYLIPFILRQTFDEVKERNEIARSDAAMLNFIKKLPTNNEIYQKIFKDLSMDSVIDCFLERKLFKRLLEIEYPVKLEDGKGISVSMDEISSLTWNQKLKISSSMQKQIKAVVVDKNSKPETGIIIKKLKDRLRSENVILVDIPTSPKDKAGFKRPLYYVPALSRKNYFQGKEEPRAAQELMKSVEGLFLSIAKIRIFCHPDVYDELLSYENIRSNLGEWLKNAIIEEIKPTRRVDTF